MTVHVVMTHRNSYTRLWVAICACGEQAWGHDRATVDKQMERCRALAPSLKATSAEKEANSPAAARNRVAAGAHRQNTGTATQATTEPPAPQPN